MNRYQPSSNFNTPPAVTNLLIINVLVFLGMAINPVAYNWFMNNMALHTVDSGYFRVWQLVGYMFMHGGVAHILFNMYALWMFGRILEAEMGTKRFLLYYMLTGIGAGAVQLLVCWLAGDVMSVTLGASGAVFGLLLAFGMMHPNVPLMIIFIPIPIKAKYFVMGYGAIELYLGVTGSASGVAHFAHLGGMLFGIFLLWLWKKQHKIYY